MKPSSVLTTHGFCPSPSPYFGGTFFFSANIRGEFATLNILMEDFTRANEPTIRTHDNLRGTWHISVIKTPFYPKKNRICLNIQCSYLYQPIHEIWLTKVPQHTPTFSLYHLPFCFIFFFFFFLFMFLELKGLVSILLVVTVSWISWILLIVLEFFGAWNVLQKSNFFSLFMKELVLEF